MCGFDSDFFPDCKSKSISGGFIHQAGIFGVKCFSIFYVRHYMEALLNRKGVRALKGYFGPRYSKKLKVPFTNCILLFY